MKTINFHTYIRFITRIHRKLKVTELINEKGKISGFFAEILASIKYLSKRNKEIEGNGIAQ